MTINRLTAIAKIANVDVETAAEYINADWDNQEEHNEWLETASNEEIADWVSTLVDANR
jgi:bacterioferritin (cytochrome b1)